MNEKDLQLARAMVAEDRDFSSPGNSPRPLKKTVVGRVQEKIQNFR